MYLGGTLTRNGWSVEMDARSAYPADMTVGQEFEEDPDDFEDDDDEFEDDEETLDDLDDDEE